MTGLTRTLAAQAAVLAAVLCGAAGHRLLAVTQRGPVHLDTATGALKGWSGGRLKFGSSSTVLPHNNTACWFRAPSVLEAAGGQLHCAPLHDLGAEWTLPKSREAPLFQVRTLAFDPTGHAWHLSVAFTRTLKRSNLVCSYAFERCADLGPPAGKDDDYKTAYDIPNRLMFSLIMQIGGRVRLQVARLDGSEIRQLPAEVGIAKGFAADPVGRRLYWTEEDDEEAEGYEDKATLFSVNYEGADKRIEYRRSEDGFIIVTVPGGGAAVAWGPRRRNLISVLGTEVNTTEPAAAARVEPVQMLADVVAPDLITLAIFAPNQTAAAETGSSGGGGECSGCYGLCVPTVVDGAPSATCFCPDGERLLGLRCRREHTAYAAVLGEKTLEVVNLDTGETSMLLNNLTNGTRADVFWAGGEEFVLFWVDAGGLYSTQWSPAGLQSGAELLIPATESETVVDVAVNWNQRQLVLMSRRAADGGDDEMVVRVTRLDGSFAHTVFTEPWRDQHALAVHEAGLTFTYVKPVVGVAWSVRARDMTGDTAIGSEVNTERADVADVVMSPSLTLDKFQDRIFWLDRASGSLYEQPGPFWDSDKKTPLVSHASLRRAGGLDVLVDRVFWVEDGEDGAHGKLWTPDLGVSVDYDYGADEGSPRPRLLADTSGGRAVRVLHPWRQPAARAPGEERCDCEQICLHSQDAWLRPVEMCACQDGDQLQEDGKTCKSA